jgi:hypothetical protein
MSIDIYKSSTFVDAPYGLTLQQVLTTTGPVSVPSNIKRVWAVCVGGGGAGGGAGDAISAPITSAVGTGTGINYTCPGHTFSVGMYVQFANLTVTSGVQLSAVSPVTAVGPNFVRTSNTSIGYAAPTQKGIAYFITQGGGGGAGGYSQGWTPVSDTVTIGPGGVGAISTLINGGFPPGANGGQSQYGMVFAGGGGGGNVLNGASVGLSSVGGAGGGNTSPTGNAPGSVSYTGAPAAAANQYSVGSGAGQSGVSGGGGAGSAGVAATTANVGGSGLIAGGGGGGSSLTGSFTGGNGGKGDFYPGGIGTTGAGGQGTNYGGGGGGGGFYGAGSNAYLTNGGNGGLGGGGGGGAGSGGTPGSGGNGIVLLYY